MNEALINEHFCIVKQATQAICKRYGPKLDRDAVESDATAGLIEASKNYDKAKCDSFAKYAFKMAIWRARDGIRLRSKARSKNKGDSRAISLFFAYKNRKENKHRIIDLLSSSDSTKEVDTKDFWNKMLESLKPIDRTIIHRYFFENYTMRDIAKEVDYTESNVSLRLKKALARLKSHISRKHL